MELKIKCVNTATSSDGSQYGSLLSSRWKEDSVQQSVTL